MAINADIQRQQFRSRIGRIHSGGAHTFSHRYIGPVDESVRYQSSITLRRFIRLPRMGGVVTWAVSLSAGALIGVAAHVTASALRFHMPSMRLPEETALTGLALEIAIALSIAVLAKLILGIAGRAFWLATFTAIALMSVGMHNMVHKSPETFAAIYSQDWVAKTLASSQPETLIIAGNTYGL